MNILHYCQHVLGMGHVFRSLEIAKSLAPDQVHFITGGPDIPVDLPGNVIHHPLPGLGMDENFSGLFPQDQSQSLEQVQAERKEKLADILDHVKPRAMILELYPFGRRAFRFELIPLLEAAKALDRPPLIACSLRDILVEKDDQNKYERKVLKPLNKYFDLLMVHSDPDLVPLDLTFSRVREIRPKIEYTGYVARRPCPDARKRVRASLGLKDHESLIIASAGGGKVGASLLTASARALALVMDKRPVKAIISTGPYLEKDISRQLEAMARTTPDITLTPFIKDFNDHLAAADLSISMAGYNTTMDILASGVKSLALPFAQNREQSMRLDILAEKGLITPLSPVDLNPETLRDKIIRALDRDVPKPHAVNLSGANNSAEKIREYVDSV